MDIEKKVCEIRDNLNEEIKNVNNMNDLSNLKIKYLGKKGVITLLTSDMASLSIEIKKEVGRVANELKKEATDIISKIEQEIKEKELNEKLKSEKIDITLPSTKINVGSANILENLIEEIEELFLSMGYDVVEGPEVEKDLYNFELLNLPKGHPARDAQDTFYTFEDSLLLRSQTSPVQIRTMLANKEKKPITV